MSNLHPHKFHLSKNRVTELLVFILVLLILLARISNIAFAEEERVVLDPEPTGDFSPYYCPNCGWLTGEYKNYFDTTVDPDVSSGVAVYPYAYSIAIIDPCRHCADLASANTATTGSDVSDDEDGIDDSNYADTPYSEPDEEIPWEVIIGVAGVSAAVVLILKKVGKKKPSVTRPKVEQKKEADQEKPAGYLLQLSQERLRISSGATVMIQILVLRVESSGRTSIERGARIQLQLQPNTCLSINPMVSQGQMDATVFQMNETKIDVETIGIIASVPGAVLNGNIMVDIDKKMRMVFM